MVHHTSGLVDTRTIVIQECLQLSNSLRSHVIKNDYNQLGMSVVIGTGNEFFTNAVESNISINNGSNNNDPFNYLSKFLNINKNDQLLCQLLELKEKLLLSRDSLDKLSPTVILGPFLHIIINSSVPGDITVQALDAVNKFFNLQIAFNGGSTEHVKAYTETIKALTHCRFERSSNITDNEVLLKVVDMLQTILVSPYSHILPDSVVYEVLQITLSMVCNSRRTAILRKAVETTIINITIKVFSRIKEIEVSEPDHIYINSEVYAQNKLKKDTIGTNKSESTDELANNHNQLEVTKSVPEEDMLPEKLIDPKDTTNEENYGLPVIIDYLNLLLSLIIPANSETPSVEATVLSLKLMKIGIDISGSFFLLHPRLFSFVSDPIFKSILFLIQNSDNLLILQAALDLFSTIFIVFGNSLQRQIELTLKCLLNILNDDKLGSKEIKRKRSGIDTQFKEIIIEQISLLWTCQSSFFMSIFADFDCDLDKVDISFKLLKSLVDFTSSDKFNSGSSVNIPSLSLEGLNVFVEDIHSNLQLIDKNSYWENKTLLPLLEQREQKTSFIECSDIFNEKPKKGIPLLLDRGFIVSNTDKDIANFLFENNSRMNKKTMGLLLSDPEKKSLLNNFIGLYDFAGLRVDEALRILLTKFRLPGESQQIERIIECFAQKYVSQQKFDTNTEEGEIVKPDLDAVFVLSYSIIMLNTDLHNPQVKEHMSFEDYSNNLRGCYNSEDFPHWYLDKIYCSIRDREIIMPEEHHGNKKWFDDAWDNIISSTVVVTENTLKRESNIKNLSNYDLAQVNEVMFSNIGPMLVEYFCKIMLGTRDVHVFSMILTSIEKCLDIACFFNLHDLYSDTLVLLATYTEILPKESDDIEIDNSVIEIYVESSNLHIPVSKMTLLLGSDFKKQKYLASFFKIIGKNNMISMLSNKIWKTTLDLLIHLYENKLVSPDIFVDFQKQLCIGALPKPKPLNVINKEKINRGILSVFASYLKGDDEPSDAEIETALTAFNCVQKINVAMSIFGAGAHFTPEFIELLIKSIQKDKSEINGFYFEQEALFLIEIVIALFLHCKDISKMGTLILDTINYFTELDTISRVGIRRLTSYKLLLLSILNNQEGVLLDVTNNIIKQNEVFTDKFFTSSHGTGMIKSLLLLPKIDSYSDVLYKEESFWQLLRNVVSNENQLAHIFEFLNTSLRKDFRIFSEQNFKWILGLLDEISSAGAIGNKWEASSEYSSGENPHKQIIDTSLKSLLLTQYLLESIVIDNVHEDETLSLIQALAHQCLNPCSEIRQYSIKCIEQSLTKEEIITSLSKSTIERIMHDGLLPLLELDEGSDQKEYSVLEIIQLITKIYLVNLKMQKVTSIIYDEILLLVKKFDDDENIKREIETLINGNASYNSETTN